MDALTGTLTTYPDSEDEERRALHADLLRLEEEGKVFRYCDMEHSDQVPVHYVIWMPVESTH